MISDQYYQVLGFMMPNIATLPLFRERRNNGRSVFASILKLHKKKNIWPEHTDWWVEKQEVLVIVPCQLEYSITIIQELPTQ